MSLLKKKRVVFFVLIFKLISPNRLEVTLTAQDTLSAELNFESESPADIKRLKKYLLSVLAQAQSKLEQPFFTGDRLLIEIHPEADGSAEIYFIGEENMCRQLCEPAVFGFDDSELLLNAAVKLFQQYGHRLFKSSLYSLKDEWLLIISPIDGEAEPAASLLAEYGGTPHGRTLVSAIVKEHGKPIIRERALDMLEHYFE